MQNGKRRFVLNFESILLFNIIGWDDDCVVCLELSPLLFQCHAFRGCWRFLVSSSAERRVLATSVCLSVTSGWLRMHVEEL